MSGFTTIRTYQRERVFRLSGLAVKPYQGETPESGVTTAGNETKPLELPVHLLPGPLFARWSLWWTTTG